MRHALLVCLASVTWVYLVEAVKKSPVSVIHYRTRGLLRLLHVLGALLIAWCLSFDGVTFWSALVVQQLVYDGIVRRPMSGIR